MISVFISLQCFCGNAFMHLLLSIVGIKFNPCLSVYLSLLPFIWFPLINLSFTKANHYNLYTRSGTIKGRPTLSSNFATFFILPNKKQMAHFWFPSLVFFDFLLEILDNIYLPQYTIQVGILSIFLLCPCLLNLFQQFVELMKTVFVSDLLKVNYFSGSRFLQ